MFHFQFKCLNLIRREIYVRGDEGEGGSTGIYVISFFLITEQEGVARMVNIVHF